MNESMELESLQNNNEPVENVDKEQPAAGNGGCMPHTGAQLSENSLLLEIQPDSSSVSVPVTEDAEPTKESKFASAVKRVKEGLNKRVVWKLSVWMIIIIVLLAIIILVFIGISLRIAFYKDPDDKFDVGSYVVPRVFSGSLSVVNQNFSRNTTALHDLATQVQHKLDECYRSSHALGRYFNYTRVKTLREGSVIIEFCLMFRMPLDSDLLLRYTLSKEMVSGVLRQHLYDLQATEGTRDPLYILPTNATIQDGGSGCTS